MVDVLLLTGNCGVGKTTIAGAWAERRGGAAVRCDDVRNWIRVYTQRRAHDYQQDLVAEVALLAAERIIAQGLPVAIDNVWMPPVLGRLRAALVALAPTRVVRLTCDRTTNRARDAGRPVGRMGERVDVLGDQIDATEWPAWVTTIDSSGLGIEDTLDRVERAAVSSAA